MSITMQSVTYVGLHVYIDHKVCTFYAYVAMQSVNKSLQLKKI